MQTKNDLLELWDSAMYREVASQSFYIAGQVKTNDMGAKALMKELAEEEGKHYQLLREFKEKGFKHGLIHQDRLEDLKLSEYLKGGVTLEGAGIQDTLILAIKREEESIGFYARLTGVLGGTEAKALCERLAQEELKHKVKLELLYDRLFYAEH